MNIPTIFVNKCELFILFDLAICDQVEVYAIKVRPGHLKSSNSDVGVMHSRPATTHDALVSLLIRPTEGICPGRLTRKTR